MELDLEERLRFKQAETCVHDVEQEWGEKEISQRGRSESLGTVWRMVNNPMRLE